MTYGWQGRREWLVLGLAGWLAGCVQYISPPTQPTVAQQLAEVEGLYGDARNLYFALYVAEAGGTGRGSSGVGVPELRSSYEALRERAAERLAAIEPEVLGGEDRRAWERMREQLASDSGGAEGAAGACPVEGTAWVGSADALGAALYACYGRAQSRVVTARDTVDRLTVLGRLARDTSSRQRRAWFEALAPVWGSVNGRNTPLSPWRQLQRLRGGGPTGAEAAAASLGIPAARLEPVLVAVLEAWRRQQPGALVEPWDWWYENGAASRRLSRGLTVRELERVTEAYYSSFGASPMALGVRYDLAPREGKTPVAFTQFGGLPRRTRNGPQGAEPWVLATYREGNFGNLVELLHETGHAIHIAAIDTRPAFADWPDSDPFTEALADVPAMEAYEGAWQVKFLGDSARQEESLREKYSGVVMDVAWALFELRMHRDPSRDPNAEWTSITREYLRIAPHPEWSWWAMRGQLIDSPGYMMNYALGALVVADVRARVLARRGGFLGGGARLYDWLAGELYRFGRSRGSRQVLEEFLGHPVGVDAIVTDINRIAAR